MQSLDKPTLNIVKFHIFSGQFIEECHLIMQWRNRASKRWC